MRQIQNLSTIPGYRNAYNCGFSAQKGRCARGFRNLPHTSDGRFRECGKNQDRPTKPRFCASATCGFVAKNQVVLGGFRFFPALPELKPQTEGSSNSGGIRDNRQHPVVAETSKGRCRKTEQRPSFVIASRRARGADSAVATMDNQLQLLIGANASNALESKSIVTRS